MQGSQESRAAPAVSEAAPVAAQHAQQAQQAGPASSSQHLEDVQDTLAAVAAPAQRRGDPTPDPAPMPQQAAAPTKPQTPAGAPESPTVHKSAESIVAKEPVKAASRAGAKGRLANVADDGDDAELEPEELGFAGHSDDAFAGRHHTLLQSQRYAHTAQLAEGCLLTVYSDKFYIIDLIMR